jgi:hypothetical protein
MDTIDTLKEKHAPSDSTRALKAEVRRLTGILQSRKLASGQIAEAMAEVLETVKIEKPQKQIYTGPTKESSVSSPVVQVAHITDWHIGEVTDADSIEGFGGSNYTKSSERVMKFADQLIAKADLARHAYTVNECHVIGTADWVSGDIHEELIRTNEFPAPVAAVKSGFLLGSFIAKLAPYFTNVTVDLITAGNHDRITRKPQSAEGGLNSWGYVVCEIARTQVSALTNVEVKVHSALSAIVDVVGTRYLITHGDGIMGTWGIPYYGIERRKQREAMARMNLDPKTHFDKIVIGHFHEAINHQHWMVGGNLGGTTAHDHKQGRHAKPHQTAWFCHKNHGEFDWSRYWL